MKQQLVVVSFFICMLCGCSASAKHPVTEKAETEYKERNVFAMDTYMSLKACGTSADTALGIAVEQILALEETVSVTNETSDIWAVNHADGKSVPVSSDTMTLLETAVEIGRRTDGALDVTLYPVLTAWGFTTDTQHIPDTSVLSEALQLVDFRQITYTEDHVQIPAGMQLDFGALAKGYAGDCVMDILKENGVTSALLNLGGNVQALGKKADGSFWKVGVQNPFSTEEQLCILTIADKAVITSGNYERYFIGEDGERYWHILDAKDGFPADNGLVSVTVVGESGLLCDALSTALFVLGTEDAIDYWNTEGGFDMILVTDDKKLYYTEGLEGSIQMIGTMEAEMISHPSTTEGGIYEN